MDSVKIDSRQWEICSDYLGNDPDPYTTQQLLDYADECNREHEDDPDWTDFELVVLSDEIIDTSHAPGNEGYIAATLLA